MMDKAELLTWLGARVGTNIASLEKLRNGSFFCEVNTTRLLQLYTNDESLLVGHGRGC